MTMTNYNFPRMDSMNICKLSGSRRSEPSLTSPMVTVLRRKEGRDVSRGRQARAVANAR